MDEMEARVLGDPEAMPEGVFEQALQEAFTRPHDPELAGLLEWDDEHDDTWEDTPEDTWGADLDDSGLTIDAEGDPNRAGLQDGTGLGHEAGAAGDGPDHDAGFEHGGLGTDGSGLDGSGLDGGTGLDQDSGLGGDDLGAGNIDLPGQDAFGDPGDDQWIGLSDEPDWH